MLCIYNKDLCVMEFNSKDGCKILDYSMLPYPLMHTDVSYDDVYSWLQTRVMDIGRTNAKSLCRVLRLPQSNKMVIGELMHYATLSDCFWVKDSEEKTTWDDVSLFKNTFEEIIARVALTGENAKAFLYKNNIRTPEITTLGVAPKAWIRDEVGSIHLIKETRLESPASLILDALGVEHVPYSNIDSVRVRQLLNSKADLSGAFFAECPLISSEDRYMLYWEDYEVYCAANNMDAYDIIKQNEAMTIRFHTMNVADYILGNDDRHKGNFGLFVDQPSNTLQGFYPLLDHDHAFVAGPLRAQTFDYDVDITLEKAAMMGLEYLSGKGVLPDIEKVTSTTKPERLTDSEWAGVLSRCNSCLSFLEKTTAASKEETLNK